MIIVIFVLIDPSSIAAARDYEGRFVSDQQAEVFYTNLDGDWYFFEEELVPPTEIEKRMEHGVNNLVRLPNSFKEHTGNVNTFGTYGKMIRVPQGYRDEALAVYVTYQYSAYRY